MSSFFLIHTGWGQESGTNGARGISLYNRGALIIFNTAKGYFVTCSVVLAESMTNLICTGKLGGISLRLPGDTSNWNVWNAAGGPQPSTWGPRVLGYNLQSIFKTTLCPLKRCEQQRLTENGASFSSNTSPTSPRLRFPPLLTRGALSCSWPKKKENTAHHTWLTKLRNNALACLRWLWLRRAVVSRPPPHCRDTEGLLHNLRPGCFASVIKGIRLGRLDPFLAISYTAEHKDPGSESLCMKHTLRTLMATSESGQLAHEPGYKTFPT